MTIIQQIERLFENRPEWTVRDIVIELNITKQSTHTALNKLMAKGFVEKFGRTPKTLYRLQTKPKSSIDFTDDFSTEQLEFLATYFLLINETGQMLPGMDGFSVWCRSRKMPLAKTVIEFIETRQRYLQYFDNHGIIDGMPKLINTSGFDKLHLDALYYLDFYAIERFGKTKLGTLLHFAKQGQNKMLMNMLVEAFKARFTSWLSSKNFDAVGFIPPTIRREVQLMKHLETRLALPYPKLKIEKISGLIPVPQKSLNKMEERIANARNTFAIAERRQFNHILLIDDAVGSGATLNQVAEKIKMKGIAQTITAVGIVGSFKGFDVVTDV